MIGSAPATTSHTVHSSDEAIKVYVRVRPQLGRELGADVATRAVGREEVEVKSAHGIVKCKFDGVFGPEATNSAVYDAVGECAQSFVKGYNATCFAYGQTGSGKTFTMFGDDEDPTLYSSGASDSAGIIPRAVRDVFTHMRKSKAKCTAYVSFLQIYNEKIFDLLRDPGRIHPLQVKEDAGTGFYVDGLSEFGVSSAFDCLKLVRIGDDRRAVRSTNMNLMSSRSHTVFQMVMETAPEDAEEGDGRVIKSKLNLVDLAGSEKWNVHEHLTGAHVSELTNINLSLHTLGRCIEALCLKSSGGASTAGNYVPYRESKLTRLLQDSLGGTAKTRLLTMVSPSALNAEESVASLRFEKKKKKIIQHVRITETRTIDMQMVARLEEEITMLRSKLSKYEGTTPVVRQPAVHEKDDTNAPEVGQAGHTTVASSPIRRGQQQQQQQQQQAPVSPNKQHQQLLQQMQMYRARSKELEGAIDAVDACVSRFFRFDIEEEEMQSEIKDIISRTRAARISVSAPASTTPNARISMPSPTANSARLGVGLPQRQPSSISSMKYRIRKKGASKAPPSPSVLSNISNGEMAQNRKRSEQVNPSSSAWQVDSDENASRLKKKLRETQKKIEKQRQLQEWQKKKATKEKEALEARIEYEEAQRRANEEAEQLRKARAARSKEKLEEWRRAQIEELNALLGKTP
eukprot:g1856.t1